MFQPRKSPIEISKEEFKKIGYGLIDAVAEFLDTIEQKPVTTGESPAQIQQLLGTHSLPDQGISASELLPRASELLFNHSLLNGHPRFMGYITSSAAPIGALADLLAATVNPNVGANVLSPVATAIEKQTIRWLAELIGFTSACGGVLVSGGNMANFTAFLAARTAKAPQGLKENGLKQLETEMVFYCSKATHTWIEKAAVLFGHGTGAIRWIATDEANRMDTKVLESTIKADLEAGKKPFLVIANAGDVSTGAVDPLRAIAKLCQSYDLWFHIDGAYGIPAVVVPDQKQLFEGVEEADSIALDPHKWLYSPLEAGCTLVKDPNHLIETYSSHPVYYNFNANNEDLNQNYYEYGFQNSRGFRALKVWLALQQVGRQGYIQMIEEDIRLSRLFFDLARQHPELEAFTQNLSITTLRYVPAGYMADTAQPDTYLNTLNESLLNQLQQGGEVFLSNALVNSHYCLRGCIVNFRTSQKDIEEIIDIIVKAGRGIHQQLKAESNLLPDKEA
jgi:aromatic-L-amino-acid/L-tryptophan decarboxylase